MTPAMSHPEVVVSRRRWTELAMLVFAVLIVVLAYAEVGLAHSGTVPTDLLYYGLGLGGLFLAAHLAVRFLAPYADPTILPIVALLNGLGLVLIHRLDLASADRAKRSGNPIPSGDAKAQLAWTAIGIVLFLAVLLIVRDHRRLQRFTYTAMLAGLVLLALPAVLGKSVNGAKIWLRFAGFSLQPAELAKVVLIIFFSGYLVAKREVLALAGRRVLGIDLPRGRDLGPIVVAWVFSLGVLVFERDLGTSLLFFGVFVALLYVATERVSWLLMGLLMFVAGAFVAYHLFGHVRERVDIWLHPFRYAQTQGYQLVQGLYGFATGGILGTGLGSGHPDFVPYAKTDFISATVGEELGLTGLMAILLLYGLLVQRGLRAGIAVRDSFGKLLATGLAFSIALQVFVVVGGVMRLIPLTGLTTPFLSYGGSSLVANWMIIALLMRVSDIARRPPPPPVPTDETTQVVRL